jgi:RimJ/RimL family protein N-acetyltransferase
MAEDIEIREADRLGDALDIAEIHLAARRDAMPYLRQAHTGDETRDWFARIVSGRSAGWWVARIENQIVGCMLIDRENLDHLYVRPGWQRRGVGLSLLNKAKAMSPQRLELWTFQRNSNARAFYERQGFRAVEYTDGRNEENEPDVKYEWKPIYSGMVISTPRLELRPLTPGDAAKIFAAITPDLTRFMAWEPPVSPAAMAGSQSHQMWAMAAGSDLHLVIRLKGNGEFLGRAGLHAIGSAEPELGIWIKETAQSRGYGSEAVKALAAWAAPRFAIANFVWPVAEENLRSRRLPEALGGVPIRSTDRPKYRAMIYRVPAP